MACCAAVIFIISQIYVLLSAARELVFGKIEEPEFQSPGAAAWRFGEAPVEPRPRRRRPLELAKVLQLSPRTAAAAFALGGVSVALLLGISHTPALAGAASICGRFLP